MAKSSNFIDSAFVASAFLDPIMQLLGIGSFDSLTEEMKNRIRNLATQAYNRWKEKEQGIFGDGLTSQSTNMPNRNELERILYNDLADQTYQMEKKIQEAAAKDKASGRQNFGFKLGADIANSVVNAWTTLPALAGSQGAKDAHNIVLNKYNEWANENLIKAQKEAEKLKDSQNKRVAEFNKQIAASHNQNLNALRQRKGR